MGHESRRVGCESTADGGYYYQYFNEDFFLYYMVHYYINGPWGYYYYYGGTDSIYPERYFEECENLTVSSVVEFWTALVGGTRVAVEVEPFSTADYVEGQATYPAYVATALNAADGGFTLFDMSAWIATEWPVRIDLYPSLWAAVGTTAGGYYYYYYAYYYR